MKEVVVYSGSMCGVCKVLKNYLQEKGVEFVEKNITTDAMARQELIDMGFMSVPVTIIDGTVMAGFDKLKLEELLK